MTAAAMRVVRMAPGAHDALLAKLLVERKRAGDAIRLIEANEARGWAGVPSADRRRQEERLPTLRTDTGMLDEWLEALVAAVDA